jgi:hypothetical protein
MVCWSRQFDDAARWNVRRRGAHGLVRCFVVLVWADAAREAGEIMSARPGQGAAGLVRAWMR